MGFSGSPANLGPAFLELLYMPICMAPQSVDSENLPMEMKYTDRRNGQVDQAACVWSVASHPEGAAYSGSEHIGWLNRNGLIQTWLERK